MRALVQRVSRAAVDVPGPDGGVERTGEIGRGLLILLGVGHTDGDAQVQWMADKLANLRIFEDESGKMNRSVLEIGGAALVVSQFTLFGDVRKGRRPSFVGAAPPEAANARYEAFCEALAALGVPVARGRFQAHMEVSLVNDGPVTLSVETP